jgi:protein-S-isoprenylcysteine O-methyltransferase Ste14
MAGGDEGLRALQWVQWRRKIALLMAFGIAVPALAFVNSYWREPWPAFYISIEWAGVALILVCIAGRTWCTAYIGGRKKRELVTTGPYSVVRNPLYVFTLIGAVGIGLQFGSLLVAAIVATVAYLVFRPVIMREEAYLAASFPQDFAAYSARVDRLLPNFSQWRSERELAIPVPLMLRTFVEACLFLTAIPIAEGIENLQASGAVPKLIELL